MKALKPNLRLWCFLLGILFFSSLNYAQSGRQAIKAPTPPPEQEVSQPKPKPATTKDAPPVTNENAQDYRCTDDGSLGRVLETDTLDEPVISGREVDRRRQLPPDEHHDLQ